MSDTQQKFNLKRLPFSPTRNPLVDGVVVNTRKKQVRVGGLREMIDPATGEVGNAVIIEEEELDEIHFVKVFTAGVRAAFGLSLTGSKVFQAVLEVYQGQPMAGGFADSVYLHFFNGGLDGRQLDMSDRTFRRGLVELLEKQFLFPRGENLFWINPNLFFRGNRATFIKSYRKRVSTVDDPGKSKLEEHGQQRLGGIE